MQPRVDTHLTGQASRGTGAGLGAAAATLDPRLWRRVAMQAVLRKAVHEVAILLGVLPQQLAVRRVGPAVVLHRDTVRCLLLHEVLDVLVWDQRVCVARRVWQLEGQGKVCAGAATPSM